MSLSRQISLYDLTRLIIPNRLIGMLGKKEQYPIVGKSQEYKNQEVKK